MTDQPKKKYLRRQRRSAVCFVRMSPSEKALLESICEEAGMAMNDYVLDRIFGDLRAQSPQDSSGSADNSADMLQKAG
ncbi:hypothetical protein GZ176_11920 [Dermatophilus congolensis]|uniref:plasmid mobilization protein n=1 Tax=Dermatophilus congolensis TaxID=1863 RepID=UPI001AAEDF79|nr:hypothetical protein [Dermatophilus congolensis]MBO3146375.1 hypothetical protein [Dermatophilus congolensis]MBO3148582.1 hypothetical protein [Dermatophilus congolensis]MBO3157567.1 hypothetical protein [Dermatophilus congolensis]MBO3159904.1 hypothetical protein [Dermatophilus congolensis]MBO3166643.1 hypothetical protein [Dermatophilus congolensis]